MIAAQEKKPPFVMFEYRPVEDRDTTIKEGCPQYKNVAYATITSAGSKDNVVRPVAEWFIMLEKEVLQDRFPREWLQHYRQAFAHFEKGEEIPVNGTAIKLWPPVTPAQVKQLTDMHVLTVEQLAEANEQLIAALGMGGRALVQKAQDYLASAKEHGTVVLELESVRRDLQNSEEEKAAMKVQLEALQSQVTALNAAMQQVQAGAPRAASVTVAGGAAKK